MNTTDTLKYMPLSKQLSVEWRHSREEWFSIGSREKGEKVIKSEILVKDVILPYLGFKNVIRFGEVNVRKGHAVRLFSFDIYAEKGEEKWLIEVTMNAQKRLDNGFIKVFRMIQPKLKIGVVHLKKDLTKYLFREVEEKLLNGTKLNIITRITKNDFVFDRVKNISDCHRYFRKPKKVKD